MEKVKTVVCSVLILAGILLCLGSVGTLDFIDAQHEIATTSDFITAIVRAAVGLVLWGVALYIGRDITFDDTDDN